MNMLGAMVHVLCSFSPFHPHHESLPEYYNTSFLRVYMAFFSSLIWILLKMPVKSNTSAPSRHHIRSLVFAAMMHGWKCVIDIMFTLHLKCPPPHTHMTCDKVCLLSVACKFQGTKVAYIH